MPALGIRARLPLGVFQGKGEDGTTADAFPHTERLFEALTHAAGKGSLAVDRGGDLRPSSAALEALEWLESHPPRGLEHPSLRFVRTSREIVSFRAEGVVEKRGSVLRERKARRRISTGVAVDGAFGWLWDDAPSTVIDVIRQLCADVSCLGEADSPAVLEVGAVVPTMVEGTGGQLAAAGLGVRTPSPGRTAVLEHAYESANPRRKPTRGQDRVSFSQLPTGAPFDRAAITERRYVVPAAAPPQSPWSQVLLFPTELDLPPEDRVRWAVALHRTLVRRLRDDAPAVLTGFYPDGQQQPANRVALQYVPAEHVAHHGINQGCFALLLPTGIDSRDQSVLLGITAFAMEVYLADGRTRVHCEKAIQADEFWAPQEDGLARIWTPLPALVAETRRQQRGAWTLRDAALLALGFVFRDSLAPASGRDRYQKLIESVRQRGGRALSTHVIADSRIERYAHRLPPGLVAQPYSALLYLGNLASSTTIVAAGQSRHLGGGLLFPVDLPEHVVAEMVR